MPGTVGYGTVSRGGPLKSAMYSVAKSLYTDPTTYVVSGLPSSTSYPEIVSIGDVRVEELPATLTAGSREREELITVTVEITVAGGGLDDRQDALDQRAWALLGLLERYARITDTTFGGIVRECFMTEVDQTGVPVSIGTAQGREAVLRATFTAKGRVSG